MNFKKKIELIDREMIQAWQDYVDFHAKLEDYKGKAILDEQVEALNALLVGLQDTYANLHPLFHWIVMRQQFASNAMNSHQAFIDVIKKAGAQENAVESA